MKKIILTTGLIVSLSGCVPSTGFLEYGNNLYTVTVEDELGGINSAKKIAFKKARAFCNKQHQRMELVNLQKAYERDFVGYTIPSYEVTFKCK